MEDIWEVNNTINSFPSEWRTYGMIFVLQICCYIVERCRHGLSKASAYYELELIYSCGCALFVCMEAKLRMRFLRRTRFSVQENKQHLYGNMKWMEKKIIGYKGVKQFQVSGTYRKRDLKILHFTKLAIEDCRGLQNMWCDRRHIALRPSKSKVLKKSFFHSPFSMSISPQHPIPYWVTLTSIQWLLSLKSCPL